MLLYAASHVPKSATTNRPGSILDSPFMLRILSCLYFGTASCVRSAKVSLINSLPTARRQCFLLPSLNQKRQALVIHTATSAARSRRESTLNLAFDGRMMMGQAAYLAHLHAASQSVASFRVTFKSRSGTNEKGDGARDTRRNASAPVPASGA